MYQSHAERRRRVMAQMQDGIAVLAAATEKVRNADNIYPYRPDSHFFYLTGFIEPQALVVLDAGRGRSILFCQDKDPEHEIWHGFRYGPEAAKETFGFDEAYSITELDSRLPELIANQKKLWWDIGRDTAFDQRVTGWLNTVHQRVRQGDEPPMAFGDLLFVLDEMRLFKDGTEVDILRRAGRISAEAHLRAMRAARAGMYEYQLEAEILHTFVQHGARQPSYESIVAGGANACTLHYVANNARLNDGDLVLIDAGCELNGYAGDITRTFPVNGRFTGPQRDVYEVVLAAQLAAIAAIRPGVALNAPGDAALRILAQGLLDLKLLSGTLDGVLESGAYRQFYMHSIGHMIGLDVHDVGRRKLRGEWRLLEAGMCTTVEPGLYIRPADNVPEAFHNIGIRIEDDVLVTESGHEVYTDAVPKRVDEIEILMRGI
ncbi:MAG TPA: aminopeptidase P N-terminal domain-containing protein [Chromobacteriaceae bacterium]|nr:aminopeptidase P N-terminal domain-containing protein [Chromobacteriaceae bacterium]